MPLNQLIVYICDSIIISSNLFLYRFLKQHTTNNSGKPATLSLVEIVEILCSDWLRS